MKIVSGGQTGVDRGALDAALDLGARCGGWCPAARLAEDGTIPKHYPLTELAVADYSARTRQNVFEADGTLIICNGEPIGGTRETLELCEHIGKPHLVLDCTQLSLEQAIEHALDFVQTLPFRAADTARNLASVHGHAESMRGPWHPLGMPVLNVAGPRASQWPGGQQKARQIVSAVLQRLSGHKDRGGYSS